MTATDTTDQAAAPATPNQLAYWLPVIEDVRANGFKEGFAKKNLKDPALATVDRFNAWMNDAAHWDGKALPAVGTPAFAMVQNMLVMSRDIMGHPWRAAFCSWAMESPDFKKLLHPAQLKEQGPLDYDRMRGEMFEAFGKALKAGGRSPVMDDGMNDRFVTQQSNGSWKVLTEDEVAKLVRESGANGPHVIVTSTHAFCESIEDLKPITEGYQKMVHGCLDNDPNLKLVPYDKFQPGQGQTIMIAAMHTRGNNFLNLANLFNRLHEVQTYANNPQADRFKYLSAGSRQMVSTILKTIAVDPSRIQAGKDAQDVPTLFDRSRPLALRDDSAELVRHYMFQGFSMGGNSFRDGMRYLVHELVASGAPKEQVREIVSSIAIAVKALNEKEMAPYYREYGVHVPLISNHHDQIAPRPNFAYSDDDPFINLDGFTDASGHHPKLMNLIADFAHSKAAQCNLLAALAGKMAITHLGGTADQVLLDLAPNTSDALLVKHMETIQHALTRRGLGHVAVERVEGQGRTRLALRSTHPLRDFSEPHVHKQLKEALKVLAQHADVMVDPQVFESDLEALPRAVSVAQWKGGHQAKVGKGMRTAHGHVNTGMPIPTFGERLAAEPTAEPNAAVR